MLVINEIPDWRFLNLRIEMPSRLPDPSLGLRQACWAGSFIRDYDQSTTNWAPK